ncbi:NTP transferase domain-containing protein [Kineosporia rhizophila]|uniref:molybdenum cofactor guanylyltransferase n=1 Tax=Kineosporia rhizophila TaxID=84633 RepID=UPI001E333C66|nr:NTP transferase domain-containing protein [Kineosporia rhizophila]MCE0534258.1 NTP transferase domain-containing protein [Kineosporia rhizophila]
MTHLAAVVLAGGTGERLGGVDKGALEIGGVTLLDNVLRATESAVLTVVVGDKRPSAREVEWTREEPPGTGPLAALLAGVELLDPEVTPFTGVFATDLARLREPDVQLLLETLVATTDAEAALFVDAEGRMQPLAAVYRTTPLITALRELSPLAGKPMRALVRSLTVVEVPDRGASEDCDTPAQLQALQDQAAATRP